MNRNCFTPETFTCQCSARRGCGFLILCQVIRLGELGSEQQERDCRVMLPSDQRNRLYACKPLRIQDSTFIWGVGIWMALPAWTHVTLSWNREEPRVTNCIPEDSRWFLPQSHRFPMETVRLCYADELCKGLSCLFL